MARAKTGDKVTVHYTGRLEGGEVFDSSECREDDCGCDSGPLEFTIGEGNVIPGFEQAIIGMNPGDTKTVTNEAMVLEECPPGPKTTLAIVSE